MIAFIALALAAASQPEQHTAQPLSRDQFAALEPLLGYPWCLSYFAKWRAGTSRDSGETVVAYALKECRSLRPNFIQQYDEVRDRKPAQEAAEKLSGAEIAAAYEAKWSADAVKAVERLHSDPKFEPYHSTSPRPKSNNHAAD